MALNPLHQFEIKELASFNVAGFDIALTNQSLWMLIATATVMLFFALGLRKRNTIPSRMQSVVELSYEFIKDLTVSTTGMKGLKFVPLIFTVFFFVAANNALGMLPGSYTSTSQISITFAMGIAVFLMVWIVGFYNHGLKFFKLFAPEGTPLLLMPLIVILELISFFARPCTLAVRLAANMIAGHILLKVFASFAVMLAGWAAVSAVLPAGILLGIMALELMVAFLQAYIFTILTCVYLNDAINLH
ncbi:MAG: ATP synthase subunit a [Proteobacteria bacterium]|nr:MAG: ATP synthase subunit a [Pseudomonadota bacterium]|tara:strand:+ start:145 stop:882 length:738 start_codon:yes stop_codon:yes gene_type:complete